MTAPTITSPVSRTLYFCQPLTEGRWASASLLKITPSIPPDAQVSHSRTTSASVVDGHSAHGADSRRAANTDSSAALRRWYGRPVASVVGAITATG
ncbi:hypothetical protein [Streptomyces olivochromogenes]|uniref:hypothetical protein n=1 Tax=Streptomyces olivochromogenes TaxID=1963 RepID=UPI003685C70F